MPTIEIDKDLLQDARSLITGASVHAVGGWILAYEVSTPGSSRSQQLEGLLRDFVKTMKRCNLTRKQVAMQHQELDELCRRGEMIESEIKQIH